MTTVLKLGDLEINLILQDVKNAHLNMNPPVGLVRISAPRRTKLSAIRLFAVCKLDSIKKQRKLRLLVAFGSVVQFRGGVRLGHGRRIEPGGLLLIGLQLNDIMTERVLLGRVVHFASSGTGAHELGCVFPKELDQQDLETSLSLSRS